MQCTLHVEKSRRYARTHGFGVEVDALDAKDVDAGNVVHVTGRASSIYTRAKEEPVDDDDDDEEHADGDEEHADGEEEHAGGDEEHAGGGGR